MYIACIDTCIDTSIDTYIFMINNLKTFYLYHINKHE